MNAPPNKRELLGDQGIKSSDLDRHRNKARFVTLMLGAVCLIAEFLWIGNIIHRELTTPTLQLQAMLKLVQYVTIPEPQRENWLQETPFQRFSIWPLEGIEMRSSLDF